MSGVMQESKENQQDKVVIDACHTYYKQLNDKVHFVVNNGASIVELRNVNGQRYIANAVKKKVTIYIYGTPGNNLASFMDGAEVYVFGNAQEQVANTMNGGKVVIYGNASDVVGYGMRGGKVFIRGDVGYRVGIHMKEYKHQIPAIVVGGTTGDFLGEYMAGGILLILGLNCNDPEQLVGDWTGTGMHGGMIITRRFPLPEHKLGREPVQVELNESDKRKIEQLVREFSNDFELNAEEILDAPFYKYVPLTHRPYGRLYAPQP